MRNYVVRHVDSYWHHTCSVDDDAFHMFRLIFVSAQTILRIGAKRRHTEHHSSRARITDEHACLFFLLFTSCTDIGMEQHSQPLEQLKLEDLIARKKI
jgi:hypothetical protein